ncbi:hypothetical protein [Jiulongibacter sp. NS-SX5]|uniref:hypothetical protein n=1 Tax=Jiulongibacter sp. NS-SX5 TaxID=3463854 RepID=UPI0040592A08
MKPRQILLLTGIILGTIILTNLPFLPGPNFLNAPAQLFFSGGQLLGMLGLLLVPFGLIWTVSQFRKAEGKFKLPALLLWTLPLTTLISTTSVSKLTRDFSRGFAIQRAHKLIQELENFKKRNGHYPGSLASVGIKTPSTGIIGISDFSYDGNSDNFRLTFYQNALLGFNYEIVTYDQSDNHSAKSEMKELYNTGFDHWKYEIYD